MTKEKVGQAAETEAKRTHCEVWTRVMGYHRPVSHFNIGKKAEHYSRKHFQETVAANHEFCEKYQPELQAWPVSRGAEKNLPPQESSWES